MPVLNVIVPNLGPEFKIGTVTPNKITVGLGSGLSLDASDNIQFDPSILSHTLSLSGCNLTSDVSGAIATIDLTPAIEACETDTTLAFDPVTKTLTYTNETGSATSLDLSSLAVDVFVDGATYDAGTMALTLTDNDPATPDITVNLADLKKVATQNTATVTLVGTGETLTPLQATVVIDPDSNNLITATANGLFVDGSNLPITHTLASAGNVMTSDVNGVIGTAPIVNTHSHTISGTTLNSEVNGVPATVDLKVAASEQICDAFGVPLYNAFPL